MQTASVSSLCAQPRTELESSRAPLLLLLLVLLLSPSWPQPVVLTLSGYGAMAPWDTRQDALLKKLCEQGAEENGRVDWSAVEAD